MTPINFSHNALIELKYVLCFISKPTNFQLIMHNQKTNHLASEVYKTS